MAQPPNIVRPKTPEEKERIISVTSRRLDVSERHIADIERGLLGTIESHREYAKSYFSMAAGALTLSVVMAQFLGTRAVLQPFWALATSWCLFALTMILSAGRHTIESGIRGAFARFHRDRQWALGEMFARVEAGDSEGVDKIANDREDGVNRETERLGRLYDQYSLAMAVACITGYVLLIFFAIRSLA